MGLFDKLFGNNNQNSSANNSLVPTSRHDIAKRDIFLTVHPDIRNLIWVGDGKYRNYSPNQVGIKVVSANGVTFLIAFGLDEEPSLIYTGLPISLNSSNVERPPYYPTYKGLTPEQKGVYWKLLSNPYDTTIDIGYVFILYYGLERFLLTKEYERVIDLILRLRDVHTNKSFQSYTANAIILTCLCRQRADIVMKFMNSLDKDHESDFSHDLYLLCKHELGLSLSAKEIMRMAKSFGFTKNNYIKEYPDVFEEVLSNVIADHFGTNQVRCDYLIPNDAFRKLPNKEYPVFANLSIKNQYVKVPVMTASDIFRKNVCDLLNEAHETVKKNLSDMRKSGAVVTKVSDEKPRSEKVVKAFDPAKEADLLKVYKTAPENSLTMHFASIDLQDFYYSYRDLDAQYLDKCIYYCNDDLDRLPMMQAQYQEEQRKKADTLHMVIDQRPFNGRIPAFKRLVIIYEKKREYEKAISICDRAKQYYYLIGMSALGDEFGERKEKLLKKLDKESQ